MNKKYPVPEEIMTTPHELFEMAKIKKYWGYLQTHFEIDLEVFTDILMECEKAGKNKCTDKELIILARALRVSRDKMDYLNIVKNVMKGLH
jgi:hypothetical protein